LAHITARLGWQRATVVLVAMADFSWGADRSGAMAWAALWVAQRTGRDSHWARARARAAALTNIKGAGALALALLAHADGDQQTMAMMRLMLRFHPDTTPRLARRIALQWWCTELAATGQWRELCDTEPRGSITAHLIVGCARRLRGDARAPSDRMLKALAWLNGQHEVTAALLHAALTSPITDDRLHGGLHHVVAGWDSVVAATVAQLKPNIAVDSDDGPALLSSLYDRLGPLLREHDWRDVADSDDRRVLVAALEHQRHQLLDQAELLATTWRQRLALGDRTRPPSAEFSDVAQAWSMVVQLNQLLRSGRQLAHDSLDGVLCDLAADLWNHRGERALGHAMFHLLLEQAVFVGDERSAAVQRANIACGS
jgi:hypothetical protein